MYYAYIVIIWLAWSGGNQLIDTKFTRPFTISNSLTALDITKSKGVGFENSNRPWQDVGPLLEERGDHEPEGVEHRERARLLLAAVALVALSSRIVLLLLLDRSVVGVGALRHGLGPLRIRFSQLWNYTLQA